MRFIGIFLVVQMLTAASVIESGAADTRVLPGDEALNGFFLAVGDYYRIPQGEVITIRGRGVPPYEIPVVLFVAKRAHVAPEIIMEFRLRGNNWLYTTLHFGLGPEIFYVPVGVVVRDPLFRRACGFYQHRPKKEWKMIVLSDDDIINLVNLKLMSEHYGYPPEKIISMRSRGQEFGSINDEIKKEEGKTTDDGEKHVRTKREREKKEIE